MAAEASASDRPIITFLSDFGLGDEWAGVCKGVMCTLAPECRVVDLTHQVPPFDIRKGAFVLAAAVPRLRAAAHLAVVDPTVGVAERRAVAVESRIGDILVGPDNGLLVPALGRLGGPRRAVEITNPEIMLRPVCPTFHARDVFAPAAAHLARGGAFDELGQALDADSLIAAPWPTAEVSPRSVFAEIIDVDHFGSARLSCSRGEIQRGGFVLSQGNPYELSVDERTAPTTFATTYGGVAPGEAVLLFDSSDFLAIAVNQGSAVNVLGLEIGAPVTLAS